MNSIEVKAHEAATAQMARRYGSTDPTEWPDYNRPGVEHGDYERAVRAQVSWDTEQERFMQIFQEQEQRGVFTPMAEGFTALDLDEVRLVASETTEGVVIDMVMPDGTKYDRDPSLEKRVTLRAPIVAAEHETEHLDCAVPYCRPCVVRSEGGDVEEVKARQTADARLRRYLMLHRELPDSVRAPEVLDGPEYLDASEVLKLQAIDDLIAGIIPQKSVGILRARDAMGKSFFALDASLCIAAGQDFHEHEVEWVNDGRVVYVAGEGAHSYGKRVSSWLAHNDVDAEDLDGQLMLRPGSVNLFTGGPEYDRLHAVARTTKPDLIVIDTLQTNTAGADHNSAQDMGIVMDRLRSLRLASGGSVLVLAHTGKSDADTRGSSAIEDDSDYVLHVDAWEPGERMAVKVTKMKDGELSTIALGVKKVGESLVLTDPTAAPAWSSNSIDNRIAGVIRLQSAAFGPQTRAQIEEGLAGDRREVPSKATLNKTLSSMVKEGRLLVVKTGQTSRYEMNEAWTDPTVSTEDPFDPLES